MSASARKLAEAQRFEMSEAEESCSEDSCLTAESCALPRMPSDRSQVSGPVHGRVKLSSGEGKETVAETRVEIVNSRNHVWTRTLILTLTLILTVILILILILTLTQIISAQLSSSQLNSGSCVAFVVEARGDAFPCLRLAESVQVFRWGSKWKFLLSEALFRI